MLYEKGGNIPTVLLPRTNVCTRSIIIGTLSVITAGQLLVTLRRAQTPNHQGHTQNDDNYGLPSPGSPCRRRVADRTRTRRRRYNIIERGVPIPNIYRATDRT